VSEHADPLVALVRETLARQAESVDASPDPWPRFLAATPGREPRQPRRPTTRIVLALVAVACAVAGLIVVGARSRPASRGLEVTGRPPGPNRTLLPAPSLPDEATVAPPTGPPPDGPLPDGFRPASVTFVSLDHGWLLGTAPCASPPCTSIVRTTDGGQTWHGIPAPRTDLALPGVRGVSTLRFADDLDGWAFGPDLWFTHDGGATWRRSQDPAFAHGNRVVSLEAAAGIAYVVVATAPDAGNDLHLLRTDVAHEAWQTVAFPQPTDGVAYGQIVMQGTTAWLVTQGVDHATVFTTADGGTWRVLVTPCAVSALTAAGSSEVALVCTGGVAAGSQQKPVYVSHDGGQTFQHVTDAPFGGGFMGVALPRASTIVVAAAGGASNLYASFDGGQSWSTVLADTTSGGLGWHDLGFTSPTRGVVIEGLAPDTSPYDVPVLYRTDDGGRTWTPVTVRS
jgi:photosystem II stability/assembly factor-like uncharacterized protein